MHTVAFRPSQGKYAVGAQFGMQGGYRVKSCLHARAESAFFARMKLQGGEGIAQCHTIERIGISYSVGTYGDAKEWSARVLIVSSESGFDGGIANAHGYGVGVAAQSKQFGSYVASYWIDLRSVGG